MTPPRPAGPLAMPDTTPDAARCAASAVAERMARDAYGRLLARIVRRTRDMAAAEDALGHAFAQALASWPGTGVPASPEAWLTTVAVNAVRDSARRGALSEAAVTTLCLLEEERTAGEADDRLGLIFAASHPAIAPEVHAPLILQSVFGVTAAEMAPAFLVPAATLGQRLVRAKAKIRTAAIPFDPDPEDRPLRVRRALDAVYALYTVATAAPASADAAARGADALHLARLLSALAPDEPEALGLAALIAFSEARQPARRDAAGRYVPLSQQDTSLWDAALVAEGDERLRHAARLEAPGPYQFEAAIQSVHCDRRRTGRTHWAAVATFYDALVAMAPSVGAEVARAAAHAEAHGAAAGLAVLARLPHDLCSAYQPYWAVRAHLERRAGQDAADAYGRAIALSHDAAVRAHLDALRADA